MITINGLEKYYDITYYNGENEAIFDNGKKYYLLEIREFIGNKCKNIYHRYITNKINNDFVFCQLLKDHNFIKELLKQRKIIDISSLAKKYLEKLFD